MTTGDPFYDSYHRFKGYAAARLNPKQVKRFERDFWAPGGFKTDGRVLEVGCGEGLFLAYLQQKGVSDFIGIDQDPQLEHHYPADLKPHFRVNDARALKNDPAYAGGFHRIVLIDVLEHFRPEDGLALLLDLKALLAPDGKILVKVPNAGSPWGLPYQYGDLTHLTAFAPSSMRQMASAAEMTVDAFWPHPEGSSGRQRRDRLLHRFLTWMVATPPEIWTANFFALLSPLPESGNE
ncbi:MAG: class I SAM-dependent methyltransferase [Rhodospirillales bacterium]